MKTIFKIWIGQFISLFGTSMAKFAIILWVYLKTNSATSLSQMALASILPMVILSPFAGYIVDRSNRKHMMIISDIGGILGSIAVLMLNYFGVLQIWHMIIINIIIGGSEAFKFPAYSVVITSIVPQEHFARAHAMFLLAGAVPNILGPIIVGNIIDNIGLGGIYTCDIITFMIAISIILLCKIPKDDTRNISGFSFKSFFENMRISAKDIFSEPRLFILLIMVASSGMDKRFCR